MATGDARLQMIEAAERVAAEQGLAAMSLREVQLVSGQRNKSAAQYHFGSRIGLIEAVIAHRMGPINEERLAMLAALDDRGGEATLRDLVEALVLPLAAATIGRPDSTWARFLFQGAADPELSEVVRRNLEGASYREVHRRIEAALTQVPDALRRRRALHMVGLVVSSLAAAEAAGEPTLSPAAQTADLVDLCTAILAAPPSPATLDAL